MQLLLNDYEILDSSISHEGAFATVYKVRHNELGYIRAVRVLKEFIVDEHDLKYRKFLEECKLLLRLGNGGHPNIVRIAQPRLLQNHAIVEMEYVHGMDVHNYLSAQRHFIPIEEALRFVQDISSALAYCHVDIYEFCMDRTIDGLEDDPDDGSKVMMDDATRAKLIEKYKVIHNDIHSKNVIRKYDGSFILLDFGLAIQGNEMVRSSKHDGGAPEYKAPEKWEDDGIISEQTDIYSFGILMYEVLAGRVPFVLKKANSDQERFKLQNNHLQEAPPPIEPLRKAVFENLNPDSTYIKDYPDWMEKVIMKCLEKKPEDRYANARELYNEVKYYMEEEEENTNVGLIEELRNENSNYREWLNNLNMETSRLAAENQSLKEGSNNIQQLLEDLSLQKNTLNLLNKEIIRLTEDNRSLKESEEQTKQNDLTDKLPMQREKKFKKPFYIAIFISLISVVVLLFFIIRSVSYIENKSITAGGYTYIYTGPVRDGQPNGKGFAKNSEWEYTGDFVNGLREGTGRLILPDKSYYEGEIKANKAQGKGKWVMANGDVYDGEYRDDEPWNVTAKDKNGKTIGTYTNGKASN